MGGRGLLQDVGGGQLQVVVPAILHEDGWSPRGDPAHDHQEKLRRHALHRWKGHGGDEKHMKELDMRVAKYENMVYVGDAGNERGYTSESDAKARGLKISKLSGTDFRRRLRSGEEIPDWFAFPAVVKTLRDGGDSIFL